MRRTLVSLLVLAVLLAGCAASGNGPVEPSALSETGAKARARALSATGAQGDLLAGYQQGVRLKRLENDLVIMTKENHSAPVASVFVVVRAGGLWEAEYAASGISHLLEHIVAGGSTTGRTEKQIDQILSDIGAVTNAYTGEEQTTYFISTTPQNVEAAVDLLADYMQNCKVEQAEFEREFGVVQREILTGASEADRQAAYLLDETMFPNVPQGLRVIGYYENIQTLKRDDVWNYYRRMYVPSNAAVCAAGDFDGAAVLEQLEKAFGKWAGPRVRPVVLPEPAPPASDLVATKEMDTRLAHVHIAYHSCQLTSADLYPLDVLAGVLGRGDSSRLGADLKVKRDLVFDISAWNHTPNWPGGVFAVSFTADPDKVEAARVAVAEHLARVCREPPSAEEVEKVKRQVVAEHLFDNRIAAAQARTLAGEQLSLGDPFFAARYVQNIQRVTPGDILRAARKYLHGAHGVTVIVRPKQAADAAAAVAALSRPTTARVVFQENGLTLLVYRTPGQPAVSMLAAMKAGQSIETQAMAGISAMAAQYLTRGTKSRSEQALAEFFDSLGGTIGADSGWNSIYVQAQALKADFPKALEVFADVVLRPAFPAGLLESTRERQLAALKAMQSDPFGECALYFGEQFFTNSPYRWPDAGTEDSLKKMAAEDIRDFYYRVRAGRNMVLAVAGDVEAAEVERSVTRLFAELPAGRAVQPPAHAATRKVEDPEIYVKQVAKPSAVVIIGYPGTDLYNVPDTAAMDVFDTICSGYELPRGWLHDTLRGQSLVYAVDFGGRQGLLPGYYRSAALCQPEKATRVARLMLDLVYSGRDCQYTDDDLRRAKTTILTARQMRQQSPERVALLMALNELYGLGYDFEDKYAERVKATTVGDLERVVARYVNQPVICIATPAPELVSMEELRKPYDAARLKEMRSRPPEREAPTEIYRSPK